MTEENKKPYSLDSEKVEAATREWLRKRGVTVEQIVAVKNR